MRTNYTNILPRRRSRRGPRILIVLGVVLIVAAVLVWRGPLGAVLRQVLAPVVALRDSFGATQVATLTDELARANARAADRDQLAEENAQLQSLLGRAPTSATTVLATVLQRPPGVPYDTLLLDVGARHGVVAGNVVSAGGSVALGTITEVGDTTSVATLYSAPGTTLTATVTDGATITPLSLQGQGAGSFTAQLPAAAAVAVGDTVMLDAAPEMPAVVSTIVAKPGESFLTLYLHLPVNLFDLRYVEVVTGTH